MSADFEPKFVVADWMPKDRILLVGARPDWRDFLDEESYYREWARRSVRLRGSWVGSF